MALHFGEHLYRHLLNVFTVQPAFKPQILESVYQYLVYNSLDTTQVLLADFHMTFPSISLSSVVIIIKYYGWTCMCDVTLVFVYMCNKVDVGSTPT